MNLMTMTSNQWNFIILFGIINIGELKLNKGGIICFIDIKYTSMVDGILA